MGDSISVHSPVLDDTTPVFESAAVSHRREGYAGTATQEVSRSVRAFVAFNKQEATPASESRRLQPAIESVIGRDDRQRILDTDLKPWRMICALRIRGATSAAIGTGWLAGPRTLVTAGHCVFHESLGGDGWAQEIEILPSLNGQEAPRLGPVTATGGITSRLFSTHSKWKNDGNGDFDVGCIHLDVDLGVEVGWFAIASMRPDELRRYQVNVAGYPADRGGGRELYHNANVIAEITDRRLHYEVDTCGGQSGAPVWIQDSVQHPPVAVGIHAYGISSGYRVNSAPRIDDQILSLIEGWVGSGHQTEVV